MFRGIFLTIGFPIAICLVWAAINTPSFDTYSFQASLRDSVEQLTALYREYPLVAAGIHVALLLKGFMSMRARYRPMGGGILTMCLVAAGAWFGAAKMGMDPASTLSGAMGGLGNPSHASQSRDEVFDSPGALPAKPLPPAPTLTLPPARPNLLNQHISRVIEAIDMYPTADGYPAATGYIGNAPALFILNPKSQISAASLKLAAYAAQPCEPRSSTMSGVTVTGCVAWVEDASIGPVPLPKMSVFFTPSVEESHVILGAPAIATMRLTKTSSGMVTLQRKDR